MSNKYNACINVISSRNLCIEKCLNSLWENYNCDYDYPVYVHYFDDIYDNENFRNQIRSSGQNVIFQQIDYKTPGFLKEDELFYNRKNLPYARGFGARRKGYLHMCNYTSNMFNYQGTEIYKYDYIMTHDDESGYDKKMLENPFEIIEKNNVLIGAFKVGQRLKNGAPHQGHLDTRVGLWKLTKEFLLKNKITPKNKKLNNLLYDNNADWNFHFLDWCDTYVIKTEFFKNELWEKWIGAINDSGGVYKYRWGDNEIISLYAHIIQENILNLNYVDEGYHNQGKFRNIQDIAPSVKDIRR